MPSDVQYMDRCIQLAALGKLAPPNPFVGCVITHQDKIIGEGYHQEFGSAHAEVNAIANVEDQSLLSQSTLYVNLEPCAHFGKTPPCSDLIIEKRIPHVVIGNVDPYSEVSGKGIEKMRKAGILVDLGIREKECLFLNRRFFTFHKMKRPYIILKWAQSLDGYMDIDRTEEQKGIHWITGPEAKQLVHKWRAEEQAILIGKTTALTDNPLLTVREFEGESPIRILIDRNREVPVSFNIFSDDTETLVYTAMDNGSTILPWENIPYRICEDLHERDVLSLIVEGGKRTIESFMKEGLWDEARILTGPSNMNGGLPAPQIDGEIQEEFFIGNDLVQIIYNS